MPNSDDTINNNTNNSSDKRNGLTMDTTPAALENWRIIGLDDIVIQHPDGTMQPGGSCDHCSTGIRYAVLIQNKTTKKKMKIGTTCAEKVGLTANQVKEVNRMRHAHLRQIKAEERRARNKKLNHRPITEFDTKTVKALIKHMKWARNIASYRTGTEEEKLTSDEITSAFTYGEICFAAIEPALDAVNSGHMWNRDFNNAKRKFEAWTPLPFRPEHENETSALFDLKGNLVTANLASTRYGYSFVVRSGKSVDWVSPSAAKNPKTRRKNNAKKGYYVGRITCAAAEDGYIWRENHEPRRIVSIIDNGQFEEAYDDESPLWVDE